MPSDRLGRELNKPSLGPASGEETLDRDLKGEGPDREGVGLVQASFSCINSSSFS